MLLVRRGVLSIAGPNSILTDIPHEYTRSVVGGVRTGFFDGKRIVGPEGRETRIKTLTFGQPMPIEVERATALRKNDPVAYYDLGPGDEVAIPTAVWLTRGDAGQWSQEGTVGLRATIRGQVLELPAVTLGARR
ncbi:MAG: hypothetical protein HUU35_15705 [Armatimonadetes bacterium]|nr:hypothetical protein [Armatimonadota bacterium]